MSASCADDPPANSYRGGGDASESASTGGADAGWTGAADTDESASTGVADADWTGSTDAGESASTGDGDATGSVDLTGNGPVDPDLLTLATCDSDLFVDDVAFFYTTYFACVDLAATASGTTITSDGLPPHPSPYYPVDDPNHVEWDDRGGTHTQNPNEIGVADISVTVPDNPVAKGITIDASLVDNTMATSTEEYGAGPQGIALNGVIAFAAMAAPGDDLAEEQYTFDMYEGHSAGTTYHYHFNSPGPLEVLVDRGLSSSSEFGEGEVELYGIMCDGTVVMGCTELDGSSPDDSDFDAQNGHIHDIDDADSTLIADRYHTHVCPSLWPDYPFFPEIAYYDDSDCPQGGP